MAKNTIARVWILDALYQIDRLYDYEVPEELREELTEGSFVVVPFGGGNRKQVAMISSFADQSEYPALKPIFSHVNEALTLTGEMLKLCAFIKEQTFCTMGDAVRAILPTSSMNLLTVVYRVRKDVTPEEYASLPTQDAAVWQFIRTIGNPTDAKITSQFGQTGLDSLKKLLARKLVCKDSVISEPKSKNVDLYSLAVSESEASALLSEGKLRGRKQAEIVQTLLENGRMSAVDLKDALSVTSAHLKPLIEKGILVKEQIPVYRNPYDGKPTFPKDGNILSPAQEDALKQITALLDTGEPKAALLHGVTGSGKTRVMKAAIDEVLKRGKSVILLVPEIALTPQTVSVFRGYYGDRIAVLHSMLSAGERFDAWRKIRNGEVDVCIGTRSAVFAPFPNLGAIMIDEEQEHTYKSDSSPKYHARDVARFRCAYSKCLMLLASATPSVESYYKAKQGIYTLVQLKERYGGAVLPQATIVDMRPDAQNGNLSPIGSVMKEHLASALEKGEQSILFINRRGYHHYLSCPLCGEVMTCPHCSVSLTYHTNRFGAYLSCHYCGYRTEAPSECPSCKSKAFRYVGYGTQRVEEELKASLPDARITRLDADTTSTKNAYDSLLSSFREGEKDIMIGTQMVTKGHDFPNVTLVGVLNADASLYLDDYRAGERTFSLITQVIGRAGRADKEGEALVQTSNPHHPLLEIAARQDYEAFYAQDIAMRQSFVFPPFCDLISVTLSSQAENEVQAGAVAFGKRLKELLESEYTDVTMQFFGPMEAPIYKLNEIFRMRFVVKCRASARTRLLFRHLLTEFNQKLGRVVTVSIDVGPNQI